MEKLKVFISYSWQEESKTVALEVEKALQKKGIKVVRDQEELLYKGSIKGFMDRLGQGKYIVLVISDHYFKSENCMYELLQIAKNKKFVDRIFPLVLKDAGIYKAADRLEYANYWKNAHKSLKMKLEKEDLTAIEVIFAEMGLFDKIFKSIDKLTGYLKDINAGNLEEHRQSNYRILHRAIKDQFYRDQGMEPPKQIKILAITASPDEENPLLYEKEQDTLMDAFSCFDRDEVFLEMPDPVNSTLAEIEDYLCQGRHDILQLTAHGNVDDNGKGVLALEDEQGKLDMVPGEKLAELLKGLRDKKKGNLSLVILSSCHSARRELNLIPTAQVLLEAGIPAVIGMNTSISHLAAIDFNVGFFTALKENRDIKTAFEAGKAAISQGEAKRLRDIPGWDISGEASIPELLLSKEASSLTAGNFSSHRIESPGRPESHIFKGAQYLDRGFIGRRKERRQIYKQVKQKEGALVLKGPGGIGKSTLTTRAAAFLCTQHYELLIIRNETGPELILQALSRKATEMGISHAEEVTTSGELDVTQKLQWFLDNFLFTHKMLIIFDNFEDNQDEQGCMVDPRLKEFITMLRDSLKGKESFLLFSTRYTLPRFDHLELKEFSQVEYRKMLDKLENLRRLDSKSAQKLRQAIGGNPRALELLDRIAGEEYGSREFSWEDLEGLVPELTNRLLLEKHKEDDFAPLFLDQLLSYLDSDQRQLLEGTAMFRNPVPKEAIEALAIPCQRSNRLRLQELSLLQYQPDHGLLYVHRLIAHFLSDHLTTTQPKDLHLKAADYFSGIKTDDGKSYVENDIEARYHLLQAEEWDQAAELTFALEDHLTLTGYPQLSFELLQEISTTKLTEKNYAITLHQLGNLYTNFGRYDEALSYYEKSQEIKEKIGDKNGVAGSLHQVGILYQEKGDYDKALKQYEKAKDIFEKIGDIKNQAATLHQIGRIYEEKGDYDKALEQYEKSLEIKEKIGDTKGIAITLHQVGNIYYLKGDYDKALEQYEKSLEIENELGNTKGVATSFGQIGIIYQHKGEYNKALEQYEKAQGIFEEIGDIKSVAATLHQVGMIYQNKGDYDKALEQYEKSLEIAEKIGDIPGMALSLGQLGNLSFKKEEYLESLHYFLKAWEIFNKIGSTYANQAKKLALDTKEKLSLDQYQAALKEYNLDPGIFEEEEDEENQIEKFLKQITGAVMAARNQEGEERDQVKSTLTEILDQLPKDNPEAEGLNNYFQMLLAILNNEDHQPYLDKIPDHFKKFLPHGDLVS